MNLKWDNYFLGHALASAKMSKDPRTKVGACLVKGRHLISTGFNGFPEGFNDDPVRYADRDYKLNHVVHAEENAICIAARLGIATAGATIYIAATDDSGEMWGGPPCIRCAVSCMQAGIVEFVSWPRKPTLLTHWAESIKMAQKAIEEVNLRIRVVPVSLSRNSEVYKSPSF